MQGRPKKQDNVAKKLYEDDHILIEVEEKNHHTHSIILSNHKEELVRIAFDPNDDTLFDYLDLSGLAALGEYAEAAKAHLSEAMLTHLGGKEILVCKKEDVLPGFKHSSEVERADRFREAAPKEFAATLNALLRKREETLTKLESDYHVVYTDTLIRQQMNPCASPYHQLIELIHHNAEFRPEKMESYGKVSAEKEWSEKEKLELKQAENKMRTRIKTAHCIPLAIFDKDNHPVAFIRIVGKGSVLYLSDETVYQDMVSLEDFQGEEDPHKARWEYLLAYLMKQVLEVLKVYRISPQQFFIIAAFGRTDMYDHLGFNPVKSNDAAGDYQVVVSFTDRRPVLLEIKDNIQNRQSKAEQMSKFSISASAATPVAVETPKQEKKIDQRLGL